jgi:hypothetical protein
VTELHLTGAGEYWGAIGSVTHTQAPVAKTEIEMKFDSALKIRCAKLFYRNQSDWLGPKSFLKHEVPSNATVVAKPIEDRWRQCQKCFDAWEENPDTIFSYCTGCGNLTELII